MRCSVPVATSMSVAEVTELRNSFTTPHQVDVQCDSALCSGMRCCRTCVPLARSFCRLRCAADMLLWVVHSLFAQEIHYVLFDTFSDIAGIFFHKFLTGDVFEQLDITIADALHIAEPFQVIFL